MDTQLLHHLIVAAVSFVVVVIATPVVIRVAPSLGAVKVPGERHIHNKPTPELGGLAILAGFLAALGAASRLGAFDELFRTTSEPETIVLAGVIITLVGWADDVRSLSPGIKLAGQILAAAVLVLFGLTINFIYIPLGSIGIISLGPDEAALLTIVAVVAMINAVNLVDGLDGLAAGIVAIAATALFAYSQLTPAGQLLITPTISSASLVLAAVVGACLGFLIYNFNPASIFMGDTGAMLLGLLLAAAGVSAIGNTAEPTRTDFYVASVPVLIPALVMAVPFLDTTLAIIRRVISGRSISSPDKKHLHHRLLSVGHSVRRAVLIMYYWSILLAIGVVGWALLPTSIVLLILAVGGGVGMLAGLAGSLRRRQRRGPVRVDPDEKIVYSFTSARDKRGRR